MDKTALPGLIARCRDLQEKQEVLADEILRWSQQNDWPSGSIDRAGRVLHGAGTLVAAAEFLQRIFESKDWEAEHRARMEEWVGSLPPLGAACGEGGSS